MMSALFLLLLYLIKLSLVCMAALAVPLVLAAFAGEYNWMNGLFSMISDPDVLHELMGDLRLFGGMAEAIYKGNLAGMMQMSLPDEFVKACTFAIMLVISYDLICSVTTVADRLTLPLQGIPGCIAALCRGFLKLVELVGAALLANLVKRVIGRYIDADGIIAAVLWLAVVAVPYIIYLWVSRRGDFVQTMIKLLEGLRDVVLIYAVAFFMSQFSLLDQASDEWRIFVAVGMVASLLALVIIESRSFSHAFTKEN